MQGRGLDKDGMITFDMEECRKFLNKVDKRAANSELYNGWEGMHPAKVSNTAYWQRWMICTPPENVDRPIHDQSAAEEGKSEEKVQ